MDKYTQRARQKGYLWRHLGELIGLGVDPAQRFQLTQVVMIWQLLRKVHKLVIAPLWHHHGTPDLLHLHHRCALWSDLEPDTQYARF